MVKIMENPIKMRWFGGFYHPYFWKHTPILKHGQQETSTRIQQPKTKIFWSRRKVVPDLFLGFVMVNLENFGMAKVSQLLAKTINDLIEPFRVSDLAQGVPSSCFLLFYRWKTLRAPNHIQIMSYIVLYGYLNIHTSCYGCCFSPNRLHIFSLAFFQQFQ